MDRRIILSASLLVIALALCCVCICDGSDAADGDRFASGDLSYTVTSEADGTVSLTGTGYTLGSLVTVPSEVSDSERTYRVTAIGDSAFSGKEGLFGISLPETVRSIGSYAFQNCISLEQVSGTDDVQRIGEHAFSGCISLRTVSLGPELTSVGDRAFAGCASLDNVSMAEGCVMGPRMFEGCASLTSVSVPLSSSFSDGTPFRGCCSLREVIVAEGHESLRTIGGTVFSADGTVLVLMPADAGITSFTVPEGTRVIADHAISGVRNLTSLNVSEGVTDISMGNITDCDSLVSVRLPSTLVLMHYGCLDCRNLEDITVTAGNRVYSTAGGILYSDGMRNLFRCAPGSCSGALEIPAGVESIRRCAFKDCTGLEKVTVPFGTQYIEKDAFERCTSLSEVVLPGSLRSIGDGAFGRCVSLKTLTLPAGITGIGEGAFGNCASLETMTVPGSVDSLSADLFRDCVSLTSVISEDGTEHMEDGVFAGCSALAAVSLSGTLREIGASAFGGCVSLTEVSVPQHVMSIGNRAFSGCTALSGISLSADLSSIGYGAFSGCTALASADIPSGVKSIGDRAFEGCTSLTSVTVPPGVSAIGNGTFRGCTALTGAVLSDSITVIGAEAFMDCTALSTVSPCTGLRDIRERAFEGCASLESFFVPADLSRIRPGAFAGCGITSWNIDPANTAFTGCGSILMQDLSGSLLLVACGEVTGDTLSIPDGVTMIGPVFDRDLAGVKKLTVPSSVNDISGFADLQLHLPDLETVVTAEGGSLTASKGVLYSDGFAILVMVPRAMNTAELIVPGTVIAVTENALYGNSHVQKVVFTGDIMNLADGNLTDCGSLTEVSFTEDSGYMFADGMITDTNRSILLAFAAGINAENVVIPSSIQMANRPFQGCDGLQSVTLPVYDDEHMGWLKGYGGRVLFSEDSGFVTGGDTLVYDRDMTHVHGMTVPLSGDVVLPGTVVSVSGHAFDGSGIASLVLPEGMKVMNIGLNGCSALRSLTFPSSLNHVSSSALQGFTLYEEDGVTELEPTADGLAGRTFVGTEPYKMVRIALPDPPSEDPDGFGGLALYIGIAAAAVIAVAALMFVRMRKH